MKEETKKKGKIVVVAVFIGILFIPMALSLLSSAVDHRIDIGLSGYTDSIEDKAFNFHTWFDGSFQAGYSAKMSNDLMPRGVMIKVYNTINFYVFNKSGRIIGNHYDIFEPDYINAELTLTEKDDFSSQDNRAKLTNYIGQLQLLQKLLEKRGIALYVYISPSKASVDKQNIPAKYFRMYPNHTRAVDAFREEMQDKGIPFLICNDLLSDLEYPAFYSTGIHWSRTFEQYASRRIIRDIAELTGKPYRNIVFTGIENSATPWYRDSDVYDLANVFFRPNITYYQYTTTLEEKKEYAPLRILIQGDSFALGLRKDIIENDKTAKVFYVSRSDTIVDREEHHNVFLSDWSKVDWDDYLDQVDVVVIEATEPLIRECSFGFVPALLTHLQPDWESGRDS